VTLSLFNVVSDTLDAVKQSAALCLLRLIRNAPDSVSMSEWSSRVIHLLNDQHMVCDNDDDDDDDEDDDDD